MAVVDDDALQVLFPEGATQSFVHLHCLGSCQQQDVCIFVLLKDMRDDGGHHIIVAHDYIMS